MNRLSWLCYRTAEIHMTVLPKGVQAVVTQTPRLLLRRLLSLRVTGYINRSVLSDYEHHGWRRVSDFQELDFSSPLARRIANAYLKAVFFGFATQETIAEHIASIATGKPDAQLPELVHMLIDCTYGSAENLRTYYDRRHPA